jgi:ribonuclease HI/exonuclease III
MEDIESEEQSVCIAAFDSLFSLPVHWTLAPPTLRTHLTHAFGLTSACTTRISRTHHAALIISAASVAHGRMYIITPEHTWPFTTTTNPPYYTPFSAWDPQPRMPTGSTIRGELLPLLNPSTPPYKSIETALLLHNALPIPEHSHRTQLALTHIKQTCDVLGQPTLYRGTFSPIPPDEENGEIVSTCPICGTRHDINWTIALNGPYLHLTCTKLKQGHASPIHALHALLFNPPAGPILPHAAQPDQKQAKPNKRKHQHPPPAPDMSTPAALRLLHWNCGKGLSGKDNQRPTTLLDWAARQNIDALCLQETENMLLIEETLARTGYTLFHHEKTAILLRTHTAGTLLLPSKIAVWRQTTALEPSNADPTPGQAYTIAVTLLCPDQTTICIASTYIPSCTEDATKENRNRITNHHLKLYAHACSHTNAILSMDANETNHKEGRRSGRTTDLSEQFNFTGSSRDPTYSCYTDELADAHLIHNPDLYAHPAAPHLSALTCRHANGEGYTESKIDFVFMSVNMIARLHTCAVVDIIPDVVPTTKIYHRPLLAEWTWPSLFTPLPSDHDPLAGLKGQALPTKPNTKKLTPALRSLIASEIDQALQKKLPAIHRNLASAKTTPLTKAENLISCLENTITRIATAHLGSTTQAATRPHSHNPTPTVIQIWDTAHAAIGTWLQNTQGTPYPTDADTRNCILNLAAAGIAIPQNRENLAIWWSARKHHRDAILNTPSEMALTDAATTRDRKRLFKQISTPFSSPVANALRRADGSLATTPIEIEKEFTDYLNIMAKPPPPEFKDRHDADYTDAPFDPRLDHLLGQTDQEEVLRNIRDSPIESASPTLHPTLLRLATIQSWTIETPKSGSQLQTDLYHATRHRANEPTHTFVPARAPHISLGAPDTTPIIKNSIHSTVPTRTTATRYPTAGPFIVTAIVNLCLLARDIPEKEKTNIVTGLPKAGCEGPLLSTTLMRPISVGPTIARLVNKILATRLGHTLVEHSILDPAQSAFLKGRSIHDALDGIIQCLTRSQSEPDGGAGRECYAAFYDITKAYDTICWSSILRALRRIGSPPEFIEYIRNSLIGTKLCMRTNIRGRTTIAILIHKAIKQGCPIAPLLFAIILDELHCSYRKIGGYRLDHNTVISSRGFCDDTAIIADSLETFKALHNATVEFFGFHNLTLSAAKSYVMGRRREGTPLTETLVWPNPKDPTKPLQLKLVDSSTSIRYLGLYINLDLDWSDQIAHMTATVMATVSSLRYRRITPLQGFLLLKEVIAQKLQLGFCHAYIPRTRLEEWDTWIASTLAKAADTPDTALHWSVIFSTGSTLAFQHQYLLTRAKRIMHSLTYSLDTTQYSRAYLIAEQKRAKIPAPPKAQPSMTPKRVPITVNPDIKNHLTCTLRRLYNAGIGFLSNPESTYHTGEVFDTMPLSPQHENIEYNTHQIPYRDTDTLYGLYHISPHDLDVIICTDGSTFVPKPSGAAYVFVTSNAHQEEFSLKTHTWAIPYCNNYLAELSALHRAIRSLPVTTNITVHTDSEAAHLAISSLLREPSNIPPLDAPGRPYLIGIVSAIRIRKASGSSTTICHIRSHTGARDLASIGNEGADRGARESAQFDSHTDAECWHDTLANGLFELPFVAYILTPHLDAKSDPPTFSFQQDRIHGSLKDSLRNHFLSLQHTTWTSTARHSRGKLPRCFPKSAKEIIKVLWRRPTANHLRLALTALPNCSPRTQSMNGPDTAWTRSICPYCGTRQAMTPHHSLYACPAMGDLWHQARETIQALLPYKNNESHISPTPETTLLMSTLNQYKRIITTPGATTPQYISIKLIPRQPNSGLTPTAFSLKFTLDLLRLLLSTPLLTPDSIHPPAPGLPQNPNPNTPDNRIQKNRAAPVPRNTIPSTSLARSDYAMHTLWWRIHNNRVPTPNPHACGLDPGTIFLVLNSTGPILGIITSITRDSINYNPYRPSKQGTTPRRAASAGTSLPLPKIWQYNVHINIESHTLKNLEGLYFIAIGFSHGYTQTHKGARTIRIQNTNYSTLNKHLQDVRTIAAHESVRDRLRPKPNPIMYHIKPPSTNTFQTAITDMFHAAPPPQAPPPQPNATPPAPPPHPPPPNIPATAHEKIRKVTEERGLPPLPPFLANGPPISTARYADLLETAFRRLYPGPPPARRNYISSPFGAQAHTVYAPTSQGPPGDLTALTALITVTHIPDHPSKPIFLLHATPPHYNPCRLYKTVFQTTQEEWNILLHEPPSTTIEQTLQQILSHEMIAPLNPTVIIAPNITSIIYKHLHTHCTLNKPLWYQRHPGPWHSPHALHTHIGATSGPASTFTQNRLTLVHAIHTEGPSAPTTIPTTLMTCMEAFKLQPPPIRLVIISNPAVAAAIITHASTLPQPDTSANTICTLPANSTSTQTYCRGEAYNPHHHHNTTNPTPLAITVIDSINAPPYDLSTLSRDLHSINDNHLEHRPLFPISHPRPYTDDHPHLPFLIPGPRLAPPPPPTKQQPKPDPPKYIPEDPLHTLATLMGEPPGKHISRHLKQIGQHTGNKEEEKERLKRIRYTLHATTLKAHARLFAWHCNSKYGTQTITQHT